MFRALAAVMPSYLTGLPTDREVTAALSELRELARPQLNSVVAQRRAAALLLLVSSAKPASTASAESPLLVQESSGWLDCLRDLCAADDDETQSKAAGALVRLTAPESPGSEGLIERISADLLEWLQPLIFITQSADGEAADAAVAVLQRIGVYSHRSLRLLVRNHGSAALRYLASCSQLEAQRSAATVITSLLYEDTAGRPQVVREIGLRTVLRLATSADEIVKRVAALAVECVNDSVLLGGDEFPRLVEEQQLGAVCMLAADAQWPELQRFAAVLLKGVLSLQVFQCTDCHARPILGERHMDVAAAPLPDGTSAQFCAQCGQLYTERALACHAASAGPARSMLHDGAGSQLELAAVPIEESLLATVAQAGGVRAHSALLETGRSQKAEELERRALKAEAYALEGATKLTMLKQQPEVDGNVDVAEAIVELELCFEIGANLGITLGVVPRDDGGHYGAGATIIVKSVEPRSAADAAAAVAGGTLAPGMVLVAVQRRLLAPDASFPGTVERIRNVKNSQRLYLGFAAASAVTRAAAAAPMPARPAALVPQRASAASVAPVVEARLLPPGAEGMEGGISSEQSEQLQSIEAQLEMVRSDQEQPTPNEGADLEVAGLCGLADLAASPESAHYLLCNGAPALRRLVDVISAAGRWQSPRPTVEMFRHATRALANLACCSREGTFQGEAIGAAMFAANAFEPLQVLLLGHDLEVVRHASRTLAELARVCLPVSLEADALTDVEDAFTLGDAGGSTRSLGGSTRSSLDGSGRHPSSASGRRSLSGRSNNSTSGRSLGILQVFAGNPGTSSTSPKPSRSSADDAAAAAAAAATAGRRESWGDSGSWASGVGSMTGMSSWASAGFGWLTAEPSNPGQPLSHTHLDSLCRGPNLNEAMLPRIIRAGSGVAGVEWLAELASHEDWLVKRNAALTYTRIATAAHGWLAENVAGDTVAALLELAVAEDPPTRQHAMSALAALSKYPSVHSALIGDKRLKGILSTPPKRGRMALTETRLASLILRHLTSTEGARRQLMDPKCPNRETVSAVLRQIQLDDAETSCNLSYVFAAITSDEELRRLLGHSEFVGALIHMAGGTDDSQQANAARALANLAANKDLRQLLFDLSTGEQGVVMTLIRLTQSQNQPTQKAAGEALKRLNADGVPQAVPPAPATQKGSDAREPTAELGIDLEGITVVDESQLTFKRRLGAGAFGEVYHGRWRGSDVAIKCMFKQGGGLGDAQQKELLDDFRNEVWLLQNLRHPNIVLLMGTVVKPPRLCIISELCIRGSLHEILHDPRTKGRSLPWRLRLTMAQDAARGCAFLHSHDPCIVHLDLKSANLVVDKNMTLKVADFGLASTKKHFYIEGHSGIGTPEWTAPEVLKGEPFNEHADVYSYGVVLWELATRRRPWAGLASHVVMALVGFDNKQLPREPLRQSKVEAEIGGPAFVELLYECMSLRWQDRPTMAGILEALEPIHAKVLDAHRNKGRPPAQVPAQGQAQQRLQRGGGGGGGTPPRVPRAEL